MAGSNGQAATAGASVPGDSVACSEPGSDPALVKQARCEEIAFAEQFTHDHEPRFAGHDSAGLPISVRELLVPMIEEHAGHSAPRRPAPRPHYGRAGQ
jgi:hypothetical protein